MAQSAGAGHGIEDVYKGVMNDVIAQIKDAFLDENVELEVLDQLRKTWEQKLQDSGAVDLEGQKPLPPPPPTTIIRPSPRQPSTSGLVQPTVTSQPNQGVHQYILQQQVQQPQISLSQQPMIIRQQQPQPQAFQHNQQAIFMSNGQFINQAGNLQANNINNIQMVGGSNGQPQQQYAIMSGGRMVLVNQNQVLQNAQILNAIRQQQQQQQGGNNLPQLDGSNEIIIDADKVKIIDRRPKKAKGANKEGTSKSKVTKKVPQLDGGGVGMSDSSSDEEEEEEDSLRRLERLQNEAGGDEEGNDEEPLNSDDDQSDEEDLKTLFESDNIVVCQFEKVHRARSKWKFILKDGIMHLNGKDYCFQKCTGEAEW